MIRLFRITALLLVAPFLTFASALAPQHVHEAGAGDPHSVAHSHFAPHRAELHETDTTEIEHDIEHVVWLDSAILHQSIHEATHVPPTLPVCYDTILPVRRWSILRFEHAAPPHGPPKSSSYLRGPPSHV